MLGVWFSPGPLTASQQRLGIRRYSKRCWEINPLCTRREVFTGLLEERPRCHSGRTESATLKLIGRELKRCEKGEAFAKTFTRAKTPKKLKKKVRRRVRALYKGTLCYLPTYLYILLPTYLPLTCVTCLFS